MSIPEWAQTHKRQHRTKCRYRASETQSLVFSHCILTRYNYVVKYHG